MYCGIHNINRTKMHENGVKEKMKIYRKLLICETA